MTYTYQSVVNDALEALNEVTLDTESDFNAATGFHRYIKNKTNTAIREICNSFENRWPFQHGEYTETLVAGQLEYSLSSNLSWVDWDSFYISYDAALDDPYHKELTQVDWYTYVKNYRENDNNATTTTEYSKPEYVVRKQDDAKYIISPKSDDVYTVNYEGFARPTALSAYDDVPVIPEEFSDVLHHRLLYYGYMFRENETEASIAEKQYITNLRLMRRILVPVPSAVRNH